MDKSFFLKCMAVLTATRYPAPFTRITLCERAKTLCNLTIGPSVSAGHCRMKRIMSSFTVMRISIWFAVERSLAVEISGNSPQCIPTRHFNGWPPSVTL